MRWAAGPVFLGYISEIVEVNISEQRWGDLRCRLATHETFAAERIKRAVILLHGFGAPGTDLVGIAAEWHRQWEPDFNASTLCVFPAAPIELDFGGDSRAWWPINFEKLQQMVARNDLSDMEQFEPAELATRRAQINAVISQIQTEYGVQPDQIVLGGFSQGAMLAVDVALNHSEQLGGLLVWSGTVIHRQNWEQRALVKTKLRVLQSHGRHDPILPFTGAIRLRDLLQGAGVTVEFRPFQGYHSIDGSTLQRSGEWVQE